VVAAIGHGGVQRSEIPNSAASSRADERRPAGQTPDRRRRGRIHRLLHLLADAGDSPEPPIPVAIETGRAPVGFQNHGHGI